MPGTPTTPDLLPYPVDTDTPDVPRDISALAVKTQEALNRRAVVFTNAAERDSVNPDPQNGESCYLADPGIPMRYIEPYGWVWVFSQGVSHMGSMNVPEGGDPIAPLVPWNAAITAIPGSTPIPWSSSGIAIQRSGLYAMNSYVVIENVSPTNTVIAGSTMRVGTTNMVYEQASVPPSMETAVNSSFIGYLAAGSVFTMQVFCFGGSVTDREMQFRIISVQM